MKIENKQPDLLYLESVLVTTAENKNQDLFLPEDVYKSISSVRYKVVDIEHHAGEDDPDSEIIGTIGDAWFEDLDGKKIDSKEFKDMPIEFNIVAQAVIWKYLFESKVKEIIDRFEKNELFCSLECWFWQYDYALKDSKGSYKIIKRNKSTAALSKYLRVYGGNVS